VGEEPNHMTARKPGPQLIIQIMLHFHAKTPKSPSPGRRKTFSLLKIPFYKDARALYIIAFFPMQPVRGGNLRKSGHDRIKKSWKTLSKEFRNTR
jgi:hypothetical protein